MNTRSIRRLFVILLLAILAIALPRRDLLAQTNTFTYQGQLLENGAAANGLYDFLCEIYDQGTSPGGNQVASSLTLPAVQVVNGLFSLNLDFGPGVFNGQPRWLAIAVKGSGGREWTSLAPRQQIMASPYAQFAFSGNPGPQGPAGPPGPQGPAGPGGDSHGSSTALPSTTIRATSASAPHLQPGRCISPPVRLSCGWIPAPALLARSSKCATTRPLPRTSAP